MYWASPATLIVGSDNSSPRLFCTSPLHATWTICLLGDPNNRKCKHTFSALPERERQADDPPLWCLTGYLSPSGRWPLKQRYRERGINANAIPSSSAVHSEKKIKKNDSRHNLHTARNPLSIIMTSDQNLDPLLSVTEGPLTTRCPAISDDF